MAIAGVASTTIAQPLDVNHVAAVYVGADGLTAQGPTEVDRTFLLLGYGYTWEAYGSYNQAMWKTTDGLGSRDASYWVSAADDASFTYGEASEGLAGQELEQINVAEGESLYLGGINNEYNGTIHVEASAAEGDKAIVGTYLTTAATYDFGNLTGSGDLLLQATNTSGETVFKFDGADTANWFSGRIYQSSNGGTVSLHISGEHWQNTVFDFTHSAALSNSPVDTTGSAPQDINLVLTGNTRIKGLDQGDAAGDVLVENNIGADYTLTLGTQDADSDYSYGGRLAAGLNVVKIGSNRQTIEDNGSSSSLTNVYVQGGILDFDRDLHVTHLELLAGELQTVDTTTVGTATLSAGSTWDIAGTATLTELQLAGLGGGKTVNLTGSGSLSISEAFVYDGAVPAASNAWFTLDGASLNFGSDITLNGWQLTGDTATLTFATLSNAASLSQSSGSGIYLNTVDGYAYNGTLRTEGNTVYIDLVKDEWPPIIDPAVGYIWSGEPAGTTPAEHRGMVLGNVWRSDGSNENTGWHEQSHGAGPGVYVDGYQVNFGDTNYHGDTVGAEGRVVLIEGQVAPGIIHVTADENLGIVSNGGEARLKFGYALDATDGEITITDYVAADGSTTPTKIVKDGEAMLVLGSYNTFTGGIEVNQGGLYLAAVGAAGQGTITVHTDNTWDLPLWQSNTTADQSEDGQWISRSVTGTEIMVCYLHETGHTSGYRSPSITNDIVMTDQDPTKAGQLTISFSTAAYTHAGTQNHENLPRHWRHLTLSGALVGTGQKEDKLILTGYCSTWGGYHDSSYITSILLNENTKSSAEVVSTFNGTVELKNTINTSPLRSNCTDQRTAGSVQVMLQDNKLQHALMDLTRESVVMDSTLLTGEPLTQDNGKTRQTYANIMVLTGHVGLRGLKADFHGSGYIYIDENGDAIGTGQFETLAQHEEVWHVRTVVNATTNLTIGEKEDDANAVYVYSGAMGFAQSYAEPTEGHIFWGDGFETSPAETDSFWIKQQSGFHNGLTELSITKRSRSAQYIHTAMLKDVSVYGGTLGFNNLNLLGNMNLVGGSTLQLGATADNTDGAVNWDNIAPGTTSSFLSQDGESYAVSPTSNLVTINDAKTLTVYTRRPDENQALDTAWVMGDITLTNGAALTFRVQEVIPSTDKGQVLLDIDGVLSLANNPANVSINFSGVDFASEDFTDKTYYLAAADDISILTYAADGSITATGDSSTFTSRLISLGYGYFGILDTIDSSATGNTDTRDYLVMTVSGDPRRTWSGMTDAYTWYATTLQEGEEGAFDKRWKEQLPFENGQVVLFGNLYQPVEWEENVALTNSAKTVQVSIPLHDGVVVSEADGFKVDDSVNLPLGFQKVKIEGEVAPVSIILNSEYTLDGASGTQDATNYYFYGSGSIRDASGTELLGHHFDGNWKTTLQKMGDGMAVIATANSYSGGSWLQGGVLVMQDKAALGIGNITILNGATLWGDFDDDQTDKTWQDIYDGAYIGEGMVTTTISNPVIANVYVDPDNDDYDTVVDARLANSHDNKLVLSSLHGESDTVVTLYGVSSPTSGEDMVTLEGRDRPAWTYAVFKVLDPSAFAGTIRMDGNLWGAPTDTDGGKVQLEIMTTAKSDTTQDEVAAKDWTKTNIDLSIENGTERTVLALDAIEGDAYADTQEAVINSLNGGGNNGGPINSSVVNMSEEKSITLVIRGLKDGDYDGALGYGEFQRTTNYDTSHRDDIPLVGETCHHYGCGTFGDLNVRKEGAGTTQSVYDAWLDQLEVAGGTFAVDHALQVCTILSGAGQRVFVGSVSNLSTVYALTVGSGGILSMDTKLFEADGTTKFDAWGTIQPGVTTDNAGWVQLQDGATVTAHTDWYTDTQVDIYPNSAITINAHNYTPDSYITSDHADHAHIDEDGTAHEHFDHFGSSHIIQLLGKLTGQGVSVTFNNRQISPGASTEEKEEDADGLGYIAIRDHNMLSGAINVQSRTVLQVLESATTESAIVATVEGADAAMQVVEGAQTQYIDKLMLGEQGGALLLGGAEKTSLKNSDGSVLSALDYEAEGIQMSVTHTDAMGDADYATMNNLHVDLSGTAASLGGDAQAANEARYVHLTAHTSAGTHKVHNSHFHYSLVELKEFASVQMHDMVYIAAHSTVKGSVDAYAPSPLAAMPLADAVTHSLQDYYDIFVDPTGTPPASAGETVYVSADTTVDMTVTDVAAYVTGGKGLVLAKVNQFQDVDVAAYDDGANGLLTIRLTSDYFMNHAYHHGAQFVAIQVGGSDGQFLFEDANGYFLSDNRILVDARGNDITERWLSSAQVAAHLGIEVSPYMLYIAVPEPATATLSLLALAALAARRRRKQ